MPYNDPDATDPNMLVGVMLPAQAEASRDMAYVFAEEFARMGHDKQQILALFKNPYYGGAHGAYRQLGETETVSIIDECLNAWGQAKFSILDFGFSIDEQRDEIHNPHPSPIQNPKAAPQTKIQNGGREE
jgi:hypothetical protein